MKAQTIVRDTQLRDRAIDRVMEIPMDEPHEVVIRPYKESRRREQDGYLFGVVYETIRRHMYETGVTDELHTTEALHDYFARKFLPAKYMRINRESHLSRGSYAELKLPEAAVYIDEVINWAGAELQCNVPPPKKKWEHEYEAGAA